jgi:hypothetical protein
MIQIKLTVSRGENFTPGSLMKRYADQTPGAIHHYGHFGAHRLALNNRDYEYHHWSVTADNGADVVTLFLLEV